MISEVVVRLGDDIGDDMVDIAFVNTVFNGELVFLGIGLEVISVAGDVIKDGKDVEGCRGDMGPGEDVKNSLSDT